MALDRARRLHAVLALAAGCWWTGVGPAAGQDSVPVQAPPRVSHPCKMAVAQGFIEVRRAQFQQALAQFESALGGSEDCLVEARLGKAVTFNALNDHKKAVAEARWVVQSTEDPELVSEAYYQIGRGLHKRGSRRTPQKAEAETAFSEAVAISGGEHRGAVRALARIYQETGRDDDLGALQSRFPELRLSGRPSKARLRPAPKEKVTALDCEVETQAEWNEDVPRFWGEAGAESEGYAAPVRTEDPAPKFSKKIRRQKIEGSVSYQALIDAEGRVVKAKILESPRPDVELPVLQAVCQQEYDPAKDPDGKASVAFVRGSYSLASD